MTEQEIVEYLKSNWCKGIVYGMMPEPVKQWCDKHVRHLCFYSQDGDWQEVNKQTGQIFESEAYALPDYYESPGDKDGEWVDFVVTDKGCFYLRYRDNGGSDVSRKFYWHQWSQFLEYSDLGDLGFTAFGGWKFDGYDSWITHPVVEVKTGNYITDDYIDEGKDVRPSIPIKIRFWRDARADVEFY